MFKKRKKTKSSQPSVSTGSLSADSTNLRSKIFFLIPESSKKQNLNLLYTGYYLHSIYIVFLRASLVAQLVKNLPAMRATWVQSLEDPLEKGKAAHSSILA